MESRDFSQSFMRPSSLSDLPALRSLFTAASAGLREQGIDQWQHGYPQDCIIHNDIESNESYIIEIDRIVIGTMVLARQPDPNYATIYEGKWHHDGKYIAVHRITTSNTHRRAGLGSQMLAAAERVAADEGCSHLRIDTHRNNIAMQKLLEKCGFEYCGIIYLADGAERLAFDKSVANIRN